ncbi:alpha/beta hydrolase [Dickeya chrysanthemi]|uniref:alpha/beta hydrolase n=1 Tax=Dickeya chrysanthemi TaxID=556 RepID=UPI003015D1F3
MEKLPLAPDFANLLTARKLMMGRSPLEDADFGRQRVARWIANMSAPLTGEIHDTSPVRTFIPAIIRTPEPIFYLHGGGLVYYSTEVFSPFLAMLSQITGRIVHAFDYPKAPETPMLEIVGHLEQHLAVRLNQVDKPPCVMGDSVGGLLALYFATQVFNGAFSSLHLLYPVLASHHRFTSFEQYGEGYLLDASMLRWFAGHWLPWCQQLGFDPLSADFAFARLPPVTLHTAGYDVLSDEGCAFARQAHLAGASLTHCHHVALPHDFCLYAGKLPSARLAVQQIAEALLRPADSSI